MLRYCDGYRKFLFGIYASFQNSYVGEISVFFVVIKTVADNELVLNDLSAIVGGEGDLAARGLVEKSAGLYAVSISVLEKLGETGKGASAVYDILNNKKVV